MWARPGGASDCSIHLVVFTASEATRFAVTGMALRPDPSRDRNHSDVGRKSAAHSAALSPISVRVGGMRLRFSTLRASRSFLARNHWRGRLPEVLLRGADTAARNDRDPRV